MRAKVQKWGNSLAIRIPKPVALEVGLSVDREIDMSIQKGALVLSLAKPTYTLAELVAGITRANRSGMLLACLITSRIKGYPFEVQLPPGLPVEGAILADQIRSLDWAARPVQKIAVLPEDVVEHTLAYGRTLLS